VAPPGLTRRGAATARAAVLDHVDGVPDLAAELRRRRLAKRDDLTAMGVPIDRSATAGDWFADPAHWAALESRLVDEVARHHQENPLEPGAPVEALRHRLGLPDRALVRALVKPPLTAHGGRVRKGGPPGVPAELTAAVDRAFDGRAPFAAPEAYDLNDLGLGPRQQAAAVRAGILIQLAPNVVLRADAPERAARELARIPQPFTLSEARQALGTTRRVAVPLLELLDRRGLTRRLGDERRTTDPPGPA
jgi:selenocysteine-specific elongation factor